MNDTFKLLPQPQKLERGAGMFVLGSGRAIRLADTCTATLATAGRVVQAAIAKKGFNWDLTAAAGDDVAVTIGLDPSVKPREGYQLTIDGDGIAIDARDAAGAFYGAQTLAQIIDQCEHELPALTIADWPDFPARGVMLDVSRSKVPTMATLRMLIDRFASWKINQLQLYTEHTFAYRQHAEVWAQASPLTADEILELDAYCRDRFIELVPNQNSFGHLERWLHLPAYKPFSNAPDGFRAFNQDFTGPFSLDPCDERSIPFVRGLYDELLPNFTSRMFNVGCDETIDLGQGKTAAICAERGNTRVYLDFLLKVHALVAEHGRTMQFWGDIIIDKPELVPELPKDIIALEWGYEADSPFAKNGAVFRSAGVAHYVCPGTSSWNSICGRSNVAVANLRNAAENGLANGAIGYLITDWGDWGHLQYLPFSWLGFAYGAALAWCCASNTTSDVPDMLSRLVFRDRAGVAGGIIQQLGSAYEKIPVKMGNNTPLFKILKAATADNDVVKTVTREQLDAAEAEIEEAMSRIDLMRLDLPDARLIADELRNGAALLRFACRKGRARLDRQAHGCDALASELRQIIGEHTRLWLSRNRPGGMQEGLGHLQTILAEYT
jgi:hexosaminidase